jgi:hypothetical protein
MKTETSIAMLAGLLLCSCAHQPVKQYAYNTATGSIDDVKTPSPVLYAVAALASGVGDMSIPSGSFDVGCVSLSGLGHCSGGMK